MKKSDNPVDEFLKSENAFMRYYVNILKNRYADFNGRASREEFWYFTLFNMIISFILSALSAGILGMIYSLAVLVPTLAIGARRLHDTNRSGWWQLLMLVPFIGVIVLIVFWVLDSQKEENRFGPNPKL